MPGLYIHIPYCVRKCAYCDFASAPDDGTLDAYCDALEREISLELPDEVYKVCYDTVFFGGGTPSLLSGAQLARLMRALRARFSIVSDAECSMECNPGTVTFDTLSAYRDAGVNRLSVGVQSTVDAELLRAGRIHTRAQALEALRLAKSAGFSNINADVMAGLPGQTCASYLNTLSDVLTLDVVHLSAYALILEPDTPLRAAVMRGAEQVPDGDETADMQDAGYTLLQESGLVRYEISNFARPGCACRHNLNYWHNGTYIGLGLAAHSAFRLKRGRKRVWTRWSNVSDRTAYLKMLARGRRPLAETILLDRNGEMFETVMLGLRLPEGIMRAAFLERFGITVEEAYPKAVTELAERGWLGGDGDRFALTNAGLELQNRALLLFL